MRETSARRRRERLKEEMTPDEVRELFRRQTGAHLSVLGKLLLLRRNAPPQDEAERLREEQERRQRVRKTNSLNSFLLWSFQIIYVLKYGIQHTELIR